MNESGFSTNIFGGFNKDQVLEYIESLHAQYDETTGSLQEQLETEQQTSAQLTARLEAAQSELDAREQTIRAMQEQQDAMQTRLADMEQTLTRQQETVERANASMQNMRVKCEKFDKISAQVNGIIAEAKKMAARVESEAKQKADMIVSDAQARSAESQRQATAVSERLNRELAGMTDDIRKTKAEIAMLQKQADDKLARIEELLSASQRRLSAKTAPAEDKPAEDPFEPSEALRTFF